MRHFFLPIICALLWPQLARGQDPAKAPDNLRYSEKLGGYHLIAWVSLEPEDGKSRTFQFDRYKDLRRIKEKDGTTYAQLKAKPWLKSEDWGETGQSVSKDKARALESAAGIALAVFAKPETHDPSQGGFVWKMIGRQQKGDYEYFTYERTREHPHPDGVYSRFTFGKHKGTKDGELTLYYFTGRLRDGNKSIPLSIRFDYMLLLPLDTKVEFGSPPQGKKR